jgi:hypothetical protein
MGQLEGELHAAASSHKKLWRLGSELMHHRRSNQLLTCSCACKACHILRVDGIAICLPAANTLHWAGQSAGIDDPACEDAAATVPCMQHHHVVHMSRLHVTNCAGRRKGENNYWMPLKPKSRRISLTALKPEHILYIEARTHLYRTLCMHAKLPLALLANINNQSITNQYTRQTCLVRPGPRCVAVFSTRWKRVHEAFGAPQSIDVLFIMPRTVSNKLICGRQP